jgi:uncharacterized LabA/DUF88 family protein
MGKRVSIYIDGGNFYHLVLKKMGLSEADFDFEAFATHLVGERTLGEMGKRYYIGTVREKVGDPRSKELMARQTSLFTTLKSTRWEIKTSKLRERKEKLIIDSHVEEYQKIRKFGINEIKYLKKREKGIDVKIVTDLFIGAMDDKYDVAVIVSSDTDLIPAIDVLRHRLKKKIEYVGFSIEDPADPENTTAPTHSMISKTDIQRTFIESELKQFVKPKQTLL